MRLRSLALLTANLPALADFYADVLSMTVETRALDHLALRIGHSILHFRPAPANAGAPFYHFAFNIPAASVPAAAAWLRPHAPLLPANGGEIVDFPNWVAQSVYARDPAGNIIECIARRELPLPPAGEPFSGADLHGVSEIGLVVADVPAYAARLTSHYHMPYFQRSQPAPRFTVVGDDEGLLIMVPPGRAWFPTAEVLSQSFPLALTLEVRAGAAPIELQLP